MKHRYTIFFVLILFCFTGQVKAQFAMPNALFGRKYTVGETYRYKLTMKEYHDDQLQLTNVSICELKVVADDKGIPFDKVQWVSKKVVYDKDSVDHTQAALSVKPYLISLDARGSVPMPKIGDPKMTEPIEDFNTFFIALGPMFPGINKLSHKEDSLVMRFPFIADFSNGSTILKGQDYLYIRFKVIDTTEASVILSTDFLPPNKVGLTYLTPDMANPVVPGTFNNFQMLAPAGNDRYDVQFGREYFTITSTVSKADGKIMKAEMFNYLNLIKRLNCDKDLKNWSAEKPYTERRVLILELL